MRFLSKGSAEELGEGPLQNFKGFTKIFWAQTGSE